VTGAEFLAGAAATLLEQEVDGFGAGTGDAIVARMTRCPPCPIATTPRANLKSC
jgi:hypothetical protein